MVKMLSDLTPQRKYEQLLFALTLKYRYGSYSSFQIVKNTMFVCVCNAVSDHQIIDAIDEGVCSFEDLQDNLGVAKTCGTCSCEVKKLLSEKVEKSLALNSFQTASVSQTAAI
jgi:bacterioferritin-associated ferredoxin|tara:strand:- start:116 stop:454 length:339 start_codon:yes stop_codon:yes gene_type:complete